MSDFELVKRRLDAREKEVPMSMEEARKLFDGTTISFGESIDDASYYWSASMKRCNGFYTVENAVLDALDYLEGGGC